MMIEIEGWKLLVILFISIIGISTIIYILIEPYVGWSTCGECGTKIHFGHSGTAICPKCKTEWGTPTVG